MEWYLDGFVLVNINENEEEEDPVITFVETINGKQKACLGGHFYNMHCEISDILNRLDEKACSKDGQWMNVYHFLKTVIDAKNISRARNTVQFLKLPRRNQYLDGRVELYVCHNRTVGQYY